MTGAPAIRSPRSDRLNQIDAQGSLKEGSVSISGHRLRDIGSIVEDGLGRLPNHMLEIDESSLVVLDCGINKSVEY